MDEHNHQPACRKRTLPRIELDIVPKRTCIKEEEVLDEGSYENLDSVSETLDCINHFDIQSEEILHFAFEEAQRHGCEKLSSKLVDLDLAVAGMCDDARHIITHLDNKVQELSKTLRKYRRAALKTRHLMGQMLTRDSAVYE